MKKDPSLHPDMPVSDLLSEWPQVIPIFLRHNMACVGCSMATFETLGSAAKIYGMTSEAFLDELNQVIHSSARGSTGHSPLI